MINDQLSMINDELSMINDQWSIINDQSQINSCLRAIVYEFSLLFHILLPLGFDWKKDNVS